MGGFRGSAGRRAIAEIRVALRCTHPTFGFIVREELRRAMTDVLTDVLRMLRLRIGLLPHGDLCGDSALDFGDLGKAVFHLIGGGPLWLHCDSYQESLELNEGDVLFFPQPQWHQISTTPRRHAKATVAPTAG